MTVADDSTSPHEPAHAYEPPCMACGFARMCRDQRLACAVFTSFVDRGQFDRNAQRRPTSKTYQALFGEQREGVPQPCHPLPGTARIRFFLYRQFFGVNFAKTHTR